MGSTAKEKARTITEYEGEDRISSLPDELIHKILSFRDAKEAVQTSVLSKRWKLIWTTLPFLRFGRYYYRPFEDLSMFIRHVLSNRNHQSPLFELQMFVPGKLSVKRSVSRKRYRGCVIEIFIKYAISHNVQDLDICFGVRYKHEPYKLSTFSSNSLKKLTLDLKLELESDSWVLPARTTLHLKRLCFDACKLSDYSCFTCLPALRTLRLDSWNLSKSSLSFSLPELTSLRLFRCTLPRVVWDLPALLSLDLDNVSLPENMSDMLSSLVNLKNLTISFNGTSIQKDHFISCPQLLNLNIRTPYYAPRGNFMVSAPKLCNFTSVGIFSITFGVSELENVNIRLRGWASREWVERNIDSHQFTCMLSGLGIAKNLSFDLWSIEALSAISDFLASVPSPFYNLKYVKLPQGYKESSISSALRSYLLGGSPGATIVRTWPQSMISQTAAVSMAAENVVLQEPLAAPTKELVDYQYIHQIGSINTIDMRVQEEHVVDDAVDADNIRQIDAPVAGIGKDRVSSSSGKKDFGLWRGHEVNFEFVSLLDSIMHKYPETFEHFTTKNKKLCTMRLNMLCTSLNDFIKIPTTEVDSEIIVEYRDVFAYLQNLGFNVSWMVSRLNFIEHLRFSEPLIAELHAIDCRIDDGKSKLQDLQARVDDAKSKLQDLQARVDDAKAKLQDVQTLRVEKMTKIQKAFGTLGTNLAVGFIGDDLLSGP